MMSYRLCVQPLLSNKNYSQSKCNIFNNPQLLLDYEMHNFFLYRFRTVSKKLNASMEKYETETIFEF